MFLLRRLQAAREAEEEEDVTTDAVRESDLTAGSEEDAGLQSDLGANEMEELHQHKEPGGQIDLGVPEKELAGVLKELELTLQMTTMMEAGERWRTSPGLWRPNLLRVRSDGETGGGVQRKLHTDWNMTHTNLSLGLVDVRRTSFLLFICCHEMEGNVKVGDSSCFFIKVSIGEICGQSVFYQ